LLNELSIGGIRERLLMIKSLGPMQGLDEAGMQIIASHTIERVYQAGEILVRENEPLRCGYFVIDGMIEVRRQGFATARIDHGGVGFLSIIAQDPRGLEAVAEKRSRVLELPVDAIFDAYEENFSFMRNALRLVASNLLERRDALPRRADEGSAPSAGEWYDRPKTMVERVIGATERATIMRGMNLDAVVDWARASQEVRVEAGHRFWKAGDPGSYMLMVDYGLVRCSVPDGRSTVVGHEYVIGSLDPLCHRPRSYDAVAETKVIGFRLDRDDWLTVIENHRRLGINLLKALAIQLLQLQLDDAKRKEARDSAA
jgi:CRP-like cAMP-binding protein